MQIVHNIRFSYRQPAINTGNTIFKFQSKIITREKVTNKQRKNM